jgi:hypothetical protein
MAARAFRSYDGAYYPRRQSISDPDPSIMAITKIRAEPENGTHQRLKMEHDMGAEP